MGVGKNLLSAVSRQVALPVDVAAGMPRVEVIGDREVSVEPQEGLLAYSASEVLIRTKLGPVRILGQELNIQLMNGERLVIGGRISAVQLSKQENE